MQAAKAKLDGLNTALSNDPGKASLSKQQSAAYSKHLKAESKYNDVAGKANLSRSKANASRVEYEAAKRLISGARKAKLAEQDVRSTLKKPTRRPRKFARPKNSPSRESLRPNVKFEYNKYMHRDTIYQKRVKKTYDKAKKNLDQANTDFYDARGKYEKAHSGLIDLKAQKKKDLKTARKLVKVPIIYEELPVAPQQTNSTRYSSRRDFPLAAKTGTATFPIYDVVPPLAE